jgi:hypothetical protein
MEEIAISSFPYFDSKELLMLIVGFSFMRPHVVQVFLRCCNDLDNPLVKFIMDGCHGILYVKANVAGHPPSGGEEFCTGQFGSSVDEDQNPYL